MPFFIPEILPALSVVNAAYQFCLSSFFSFCPPSPLSFFLFIQQTYGETSIIEYRIFITMKLSPFMLDFHSRFLVLVDLVSYDKMGN